MIELTGIPGGAAGGEVADRPVLRLVRGEPTAEELAALVVVLAARSGGASGAPSEPRSLWRDRTARIGAPLVPGSGAWRASGLPR